MNENKTEQTNGSRSFEERVFARFDAVEDRIGRLEMKQLDTKPIWERALAAIEETNVNMRNGFEAVGQSIDQINGRLDAMDKRFAGVDARFNELSTQLDDGIRGVEQKMDVLNQYFLELRADQRYTDRRLEKIESQLKPS